MPEVVAIQGGVAGITVVWVAVDAGPHAVDLFEGPVAAVVEGDVFCHFT